MVTEERIILIVMTSWIAHGRKAAAEDWAIREQVIMELLDVYGINVDGLEEMVKDYIKRHL